VAKPRNPGIAEIDNAVEQLVCRGSRVRVPIGAKVVGRALVGDFQNDRQVRAGGKIPQRTTIARGAQVIDGNMRMGQRTGPVVVECNPIRLDLSLNTS